jgi:carbonic anhydrase
MPGITWLHDPTHPIVEHVPDGPAGAIGLLDAGNAAFAGIDQDASESLVLPVTSADLGFGAEPGVAPAQAPFAAVVGCADARVPVELLFLQSANDLFVVRVAGNVLGAECVGSIDYAIGHLPSVRLLAVVGHTSCGAVGAAVDAYLDPSSYLGLSANLPLRAIVDAIVPTVRAADLALRDGHGDGVGDLPGFRAALLDSAVVLNAAVGADAVQRLFAEHLGDTLGVGFGVYNLASRTVGLPSTAPDGPAWTAGLVDPPEVAHLPTLAQAVAVSRYVGGLLHGPAAAAH